MYGVQIRLRDDNGGPPEGNYTCRSTAVLAVCLLGLLATACTESGSAGSGSPGKGTAIAEVDPTTVGLWNDGPCNDSLDKLVVGIHTTFESPVLTAKDSALALQAAAVGFNKRGGANNHCIQVVTCDEKADPNQAIDCARTLDHAGVAATVNDGSLAPGPEVGQIHAADGVPRFFIATTTPDLVDTNAYPFDAGGIGTTMVMPQALVDQGVKKIASIRVDVAGASALIPIFQKIYGASGVTFVADIPVPAGTTDYSQFILAAQDAGADGIMVALGGQEAIQVLRAAHQLGSELPVSTSLGTLSYQNLKDLGDYASHVTLNGSSAPATADVPVMPVLLADLAASGEDLLQPANLKATPMHSWMGLYALLSIIRTSSTEDFSPANLTSLIKASGPIDMLGLTAPWTPNTNNPGIFPRTGNGFYSLWSWDPTAEFNGSSGNLVQGNKINFNNLICGSAIGGPAGSC
jgi:branched-chain amino acid transport system substrate-binding protein